MRASCHFNTRIKLLARFVDLHVVVGPTTLTQILTSHYNPIASNAVIHVCTCHLTQSQRHKSLKGLIAIFERKSSNKARVRSPSPNKIAPAAILPSPTPSTPPTPRTSPALQRKVISEIFITKEGPTFEVQPGDNDWTDRYHGSVSSLRAAVESRAVELPASGVVLRSARLSEAAQRPVYFRFTCNQTAAPIRNAAYFSGEEFFKVKAQSTLTLSTSTAHSKLTTPAWGTVAIHRGMRIGSSRSGEHEDACERAHTGCMNRSSTTNGC